jgi:ferritin|tara:strand:+ start:4960 stop:5175 length:216 start_codon:yes stop_codon:yes gene_type:complete
MKKDIEKAIREVLVIENKQSLPIAVDRMSKLFDNSKRSELLKFMDWHYEEDIADQKTKETIVDAYLANDEV